MAALTSHTADEASSLGAIREVTELHRVHLVGHSFGGATVVKAVQELSGVSVPSVSIFDPWAFPLADSVLDRGLEQPLLSGAAPVVYFLEVIYELVMRADLRPQA